MTTHRFTSHIAGAGTSGGTRLVLGCWWESPHGPFADVMVAHPDGRGLGTLTTMDPPPDFGVSSTPREPSLTALTSTVHIPDDDAASLPHTPSDPGGTT